MADADVESFFVSIHQGWFIGGNNYGLAVDNTTFLIECYWRYLHKRVDGTDPGVVFWGNDLVNNGYGDPANADGVLHIISAFLHSGVPDGYRQRFGAP